MFRALAPTALGLIVAIAAVPTTAHAQYYRPQTNVGFSISTPNFSLGIGNAPVYATYPVAPAPVVVPPVYYPPVVAYPYRPVYPVVPHWTPYRGWHTHGPAHYGPPHGPYRRPY